MKLSKIIHLLNDGELEEEYLQMFGGYETIFKMLAKRDLLDKLEIGTSDSYAWENEFLIFLSKYDRKEFIDIVVSNLNDIEITNGTIYYVSDNLGDLSLLFSDSSSRSYYVSQKRIKSILEGDSDVEYFNHSVDVYEDIIINLNESNLNKLKELVLNDLSSVSIFPVTDTLQELSNESNEVFLNNENIDSVFSDDETINYILSEYLPDVESELQNIYTQSQNIAYNDELYELIWDELGRYFVHDDIEWFTAKHPYKKDTNIQKFKMKVWNFESNILDFLNADPGNYNTRVSYFGSYLTILEYLVSSLDSHERLKVYYPDWPNSDKVNERINEIFPDYF